MSIFNRNVATEANDYFENKEDKVFVWKDGHLVELEVKDDDDTEERKPGK